MEINVKCMFLGKFEGKTKNGDDFKQLKFLDKGSNDTITVYCNDFGKFAKQNPYTDVEVTFNLYKDSKGLYRLGLVGD